MDEFQKHAIGNHERRHRDAIRKAVAEIREYADYIERDLNKGRTSSHYAETVLIDAQTVVTRFSMLAAMRDVAGIMAPSPVSPSPVPKE